MSALWGWIRARLRHRQRMIGAGDLAFLFEGEQWRSVTRDQRPDLFFEPEVCQVCGCTEERSCPNGCFWVGRGLCSRCVGGYGGTDR